MRASDLANRLVSAMPDDGSISRRDAEHVLQTINRHWLSAKQINHIISIAICRRQIVCDHGGAILRR